MSVLVNIRGCNGAGKSTIPMSMMNDPCMRVIHMKYKGKRKGAVTVFPNYGWVALGTYFNKTGGMDTFPNNEFTRKVFFKALETFPQYDILMEGIMCSTIKSTYANLFKEAQEKYPDRKVIVLTLLPPVEICLNRIQVRNGGKPIKEELVEGKWRTVQKAIGYFKEEGFVSIKVDSSKVKKENMLAAFLKTVNKHRR